MANKGGFSWKRAVGITKAKQKISKATGIPLTKSGRQRKIGKMVTGGGCMLGVFLIVVLISSIIFISFGLLSCKQATTTLTQTTKTKNSSELSISQKKQAYYDLIVLQDKISAETPPDRAEKMSESYLIIAKNLINNFLA